MVSDCFVVEVFVACASPNVAWNPAEPNSPNQRIQTGQPFLTLKEVRRQGKRRICLIPWSAGHVCGQNRLRDNINYRLRSGEHRTYIISNLIGALEKSLKPESTMNIDCQTILEDTHMFEAEISSIENSLYNSHQEIEIEGREHATNFLCNVFSAAPCVCDTHSGN